MAVNERQSIELDVSPAVAWQQLHPVFEGMARESISNEVDHQARSVQIVTTDGSRLAVTSISIEDAPRGANLHVTFSCPNPGWRAPLIARELRRDMESALPRWKAIAEGREGLSGS